jgi:hypothetical protein
MLLLLLLLLLLVGLLPRRDGLRHLFKIVVMVIMFVTCPTHTHTRGRPHTQQHHQLPPFLLLVPIAKRQNGRMVLLLPHQDAPRAPVHDPMGGEAALAYGRTTTHPAGAAVVAIIHRRSATRDHHAFGSNAAAAAGTAPSGEGTQDGGGHPGGGCCLLLLLVRVVLLLMLMLLLVVMLV